MLNRNLTSRLERIDWDFAGTPSESPFSPLHWHPARLPSQIAATLIGLLTEEGDSVLDPFLGSGTTVVEAQRLCRKGIGFDINPVACLISAAKTLQLSSEKIDILAATLKADARESLSTGLLYRRNSSVTPKTVQTKWYAPKVMNDLSTLWVSIRKLKGAKKTLAQMAFSASLLPVCKETRHWGYVCDNSTPKTEHEGDVLTEYCRLLDRLGSAYRERDADMYNSGFKTISPVLLKCEDSRQSLARIAAESIRLLLTSPPYSGVSDYVKSQRLTMEWLGREIEPVRLLEIGARSKRHRRKASDEFLTEIEQVFVAARRTLRSDGALVTILGESSKRASYIDDFHKMLRRSDYKLAFTTTRTISQQRRQYNSIEMEYITVAIPR